MKSLPEIIQENSPQEKSQHTALPSHSPLPWRIWNHYRIGWERTETSGEIKDSGVVCDLANNKATRNLKNAANAELIVRSVNNHAALVEALKATHYALMRTQQELRSAKSINHSSGPKAGGSNVWGPNSEEADAKASAAILQAEAALRKAGE